MCDSVNQEKEKRRMKFMKWSKWQYLREITLKRFFYVIFCIISILCLNDILQVIIFLCSLLLLIRNIIQFHSEWKTVGRGPHYLYMDQVYDTQIMTKLIPNLHSEFQKYGIKMTQKPIKNQPESQSYVGYDEDNNKITFVFYCRHEEMRNEDNCRYPMLLTFSYKDEKDKIVGEIDLSNNVNVGKAVILIINTLKEDNLIDLVDGDERVN